jgi:hypothetical protein
MNLEGAYGGIYHPNIIESFDDVFTIDLESRKIAEKIKPGSSMLMKLPPQDPQSLLDLKKKVAWLGGVRKVLSYLKFLMGKGLDWMASFGWTDIDLYAMFCFGAIKEWRYTLRIEQGRATRTRALPQAVAASNRASVDEWNGEDEDDGW